eukprot:sb/3476621/
MRKGVKLDPPMHVMRGPLFPNIPLRIRSQISPSSPVYKIKGEKEREMKRERDKDKERGRETERERDIDREREEKRERDVATTTHPSFQHKRLIMFQIVGKLLEGHEDNAEQDNEG